MDVTKMEAQVIDSIWEVHRQDQDYLYDKYVVARSVWYEGQYETMGLYFNSLEEVVSYFLLEEVGDGLYDPEERILVFTYNLPTGPISHLYAFFLESSFEAVIEALSNSYRHLEAKDLDTMISRKVLEVGDPGFYVPSQITDPEEPFPDPCIEGCQEVSHPDECRRQCQGVVTLQDYTYANLTDFNRAITTDLNRKYFGTERPNIVTPESWTQSSAPYRSNAYFDRSQVNAFPENSRKASSETILFREYDDVGRIGNPTTENFQGPVPRFSTSDDTNIDTFDQDELTVTRGLYDVSSYYR